MLSTLAYYSSSFRNSAWVYSLRGISVCYVQGRDVQSTPINNWDDSSSLSVFGPRALISINMQFGEYQSILTMLQQYNHPRTVLKLRGILQLFL